MSWALLAPGAHSSSRAALRSLARHGAHARRSNRASYRRGILPSIALGAVVLAVASVWGWNLSGGQLVVMQTPSMCPAVCVGSLVADRPLRGAVHVGELITFHPPDNRAETYTHEISRIFSNGAIQTRGIADATHDPWLITRSDIVGVVDFTLWELGWVLKALPLLAVGVLFWVVARPWIGERARRGWDSGWMTVLTVVPLWMLHPLVRATVISSTLDASQHRHLATDTIVNTGILPVSFRATGGRAVQVSSTGVVHVSGVSVNGSLKLHEAASLPWWGLAIVVLSVLSPLAGCLWHIWRDTAVVPNIGDAATSPIRLIDSNLDVPLRCATSRGANNDLLSEFGSLGTREARGKGLGYSRSRSLKSPPDPFRRPCIGAGGRRRPSRDRPKPQLLASWLRISGGDNR